MIDINKEFKRIFIKNKKEREEKHIYIVDEFFIWTFIITHEATNGPL